MNPIPAKTGFSKPFTMFFTSIFIAIVIINIIVIAYQEGSIAPAIKELGSKLLLVTKEITDQCNSIVNNHGIASKQAFPRNLPAFLITYGLLFEALYTAYLWILVLMWCVSVTPFSEKGKTFVNFSFALIIFFGLQSIITVSDAAINKEIACFYGCDNSTFNYMISPIVSFLVLFKAIPYLIRAKT